MDAQQQQQYHYQYQQQQSVVETTSYDPSQIQQSYDQSSSYYYQYPYNTQTQQPQDYSSYYYHQTTDPNSIHPPGVPLTLDSQQTHLLNHHNFYYPQPTSYQGFYPAGGTQTSQPVRGRGTFGRHGRGRGGGRSKPQTTPNNEPRMAWCEVCRTDCTTFEVLEQHKNGKRHKKNLKIQAELMDLSKQLALPNPETIPPQNENITPQSASSVGRGGLKRKSRGGRGGKLMRAFDGSRRPVDPPKPVVPYICELCNVKCESQVVFQTHVTGKKHIANMKRFEGHKEVFGEGIQALYPSISNLIPSTSIISQPTQPNAPLDAQTLASMILSQQNIQDPQAAQQALTQLLNQHGIHDTQTFISQLLPSLLTQFQVPGSLPAQLASLGIPSGHPPSQVTPVSVVESQTNEKQANAPV